MVTLQTGEHVRLSARWTAMLLLIGGCGSAPQPAAEAPVPATLDEFRAAVARVLEETGVPGAGIALVHQTGIEWQGGVGYANRDARTAVTADTGFRVGSISKSLIAVSLVQLTEDGLLDFESPVVDVAPDIVIDNPWAETDPVRVIHVLEHTAGFDDMHFSEMYLPPGAPVPSLEEVIRRHPDSRRVRWRPGTRMAYSNPGYAVAGRILELTAGETFEEYVARDIFGRLNMTRSGFTLTPEAETQMAQGYSGPHGPPVGFPQIYLQPAGGLYSTPHDLGRFVQMLLNWGELDTIAVVDPEYLGNMEQPRSSIAAAAGLRSGYGVGITTMLNQPYPLLGHGGGISGFTSTYAYSPSRDVGFVVLLNQDGPAAGAAMRRISRLAISYLKRDVAPPERPAATIAAATLDAYAGYYHPANPRNAVMWPVEWLLAGQTITRDGQELAANDAFGGRTRIVPVTDRLMRLDSEIAASRVFVEEPPGALVLAGGAMYLERQPRWRVELVRVPVVAAVAVMLSVFMAWVAWLAHARRAAPRGFWALKVAMLGAALALATPLVVYRFTPMTLWGTANPATFALFLATAMLPVLGVFTAILTARAASQGARSSVVTYGFAVAAAALTVSVYLGSHGLLAFRTWLY